MTQLPQPGTSTPQLHPNIAGKMRQLAREPATRILDLGCGSGALLERLARMGYRDLTGVDISPPASGGCINYSQADLDCFRLDCPDGAFDLALAVEVIEHIENPGLFLAELARLLAPPRWCRLVHDPKSAFGSSQVAFRAQRSPQAVRQQGRSHPHHADRAVSIHTPAESPWLFCAGELGLSGRRQFAHVEAVDAPGGTAVAAHRANI